MKVVREAALRVLPAPVVQIEAGAQPLDVLDDRLLIGVECKVHGWFPGFLSMPAILAQAGRGDLQEASCCVFTHLADH
ncbi:MAG TPA: hypothetical protein VF469_16060 [Kofleriaceae bacterium]